MFVQKPREFRPFMAEDSDENGEVMPRRVRIHVLLDNATMATADQMPYEGYLGFSNVVHH